MNNNAYTLAVDFLGELEENLGLHYFLEGLVDGFRSKVELFEKSRRQHSIWKRDAFHIVPDGRALISVMEEDHLVIRWEHPSGYRYRTRMAESLRMMSRLRQLSEAFKDAGGMGYQSRACIEISGFFHDPAQPIHVIILMRRSLSIL